MLHLKHTPFVNAANYVLDKSGTHSEVPDNTAATNQNQSGYNFMARSAAPGTTGVIVHSYIL